MKKLCTKAMYGVRYIEKTVRYNNKKTMYTVRYDKKLCTKGVHYTL